MSFAHPLLAVAALVVLAIAAAVEAFLRVRERAFVHPNVAFLSRALRSPSWLHVVLFWMSALSVAAIVLAAAGPRTGTSQGEAATIAVCIDTSGSMNSRDVRPTRARAAARAVREFAAALPAGTRVAIVSFAGVAVTQLPPTTERATIVRALSKLPEPNGQTAIGDALLRAGSLLPAAGPRGVLVLTDGKNNRGTDPKTALAILHASRIATEIVQIAGGKVVLARMREFSARLQSAGARDWAQPLAFGGLALLAAAWLTRERGAFRF